eukprot:GHVU01036274.1.p1 GENE.GHVU01036274.1~~GHVU01036274.1.p1  ORF type:complete len:118 (-),score=6.02 GHVU01036274.1:190-543(-)
MDGWMPEWAQTLSQRPECTSSFILVGEIFIDSIRLYLLICGATFESLEVQFGLHSSSSSFRPSQSAKSSLQPGLSLARSDGSARSALSRLARSLARSAIHGSSTSPCRLGPPPEMDP